MLAVLAPRLSLWQQWQIAVEKPVFVYRAVSHLFTEKIIAEMLGYQTPQGVSPFYEALGRHFFKMEFDACDELTAKGKKSFIAELMPRQPIYVAYMPADAQESVGKVHTNTAPARRLLEQEGMYYDGLSIFSMLARCCKRGCASCAPCARVHCR